MRIYSITGALELKRTVRVSQKVAIGALRCGYVRNPRVLAGDGTSMEGGR